MPFYGWIGEIVETGRIGTEELSVEWRIRNVLSKSGGSDAYYDSLGFGFSNHWRLSMYPNRTEESRNPASGWVDLRLRRTDGGPPKTFSVKIGIKASTGVEKERESEREFSNRDWYCDWGQFCSRSELSEHGSRLMPDDVLSIKCVIKTPSAAKGTRKSLRIRKYLETKDSSVISKKVQGKKKSSKKIKFSESKEASVREKAQGKKKPSKKRKFPGSKKANVGSKKIQGKRKSSKKRKFPESKKIAVSQKKRTSCSLRNT